MNRLIRLFSTSVGRELIMAITGALLVLFLTVHMLGNMKLFQGPEALNSYAAWLAGHPLLWVARFGLLALFGMHILLGFSLARQNLAARPQRYCRYETLRATAASRYMLLSGLAILAFLIFHLLHCTIGVIDSAHTHLVDGENRRDVYRMVVLGFQNPWISGSYMVAMLVLGLHLIHGASSLFQSLGLNHESYDVLIRAVCAIVVFALVVGNCSMPVLVLIGSIEAGPS